MIPRSVEHIISYAQSLRHGNKFSLPRSAAQAMFEVSQAVDSEVVFQHGSLRLVPVRSRYFYPPEIMTKLADAGFLLGMDAWHTKWKSWWRWNRRNSKPYKHPYSLAGMEAVIRYAEVNSIPLIQYMALSAAVDAGAQASLLMTHDSWQDGAGYRRMLVMVSTRPSNADYLKLSDELLAGHNDWTVYDQKAPTKQLDVMEAKFAALPVLVTDVRVSDEEAVRIHADRGWST